MIHFARRLAICCCLPVLGTALAGCYVPDYHTPKGFSSTFHRRLLDSEQYDAVPGASTLLPGPPQAMPAPPEPILPGEPGWPREPDWPQPRLNVPDANPLPPLPTPPPPR